MMEIHEKQAKDWIESKSKAYELTVKDNDLVVTKSTDASFIFTVTCPQGEGTKFSVWSESPVVIPHLTSCLEFCESSKCCEIKQVLEYMDEHLSQETAEGDDDDEDDDDDDYNEYYVEDDLLEDPPERKEEKDSDEEEVESFFGKGGASAAAFQRLRKDLKNMKSEAHKFGIVGNPRGDNFFVWDVKLTGFAADSRLGKDLQAFATKYNREPVVYLEMQFPPDYPMAPPFVRVTRPRFKFLTGHVTIGGSICMEMLTRSGWRPTNDIESILVQVRSEIMSDNNAALDSNPDRAYSEDEAKDAFQRMVSRYGWNS